MSEARFAGPVLEPHRSQPVTQARNDPKTLLVEFDTSLRCLVLTAMRPKPGKEGEPTTYVTHAERKPTLVPLENVLCMR